MTTNRTLAAPARGLVVVPIAFVAAAAGAVIAYGIWLALGSPAGSTTLFDVWIYHATFALSAAACFARAAIGAPSRAAWLALGLGLAAWSAGDLYWTLALSGRENIPVPSLADALYLAMIPCALVGIVLLVRQRVGRFTAGRWLDGAIGALGAAALATAMLGPAFDGLTQGATENVLTNLSYPIGDVMLLALVVGGIAVGGWRGNGSLILIGAGLTVWSITDGTYLYLVATDAYKAGPIDLLWPVGAVLIGAAAVPAERRTALLPPSTRAAIVVAAGAAIVSVGVLIWDHFHRATTAAIWLAGMTLAAVTVRLLLVARENDRLLGALHDDATTDALTGLANRRRLFADLEHLLEGPDEPADHVFALFDLDGFKAYNDSFGHPAGDALLSRFGSRLAASTEAGAAYRLGGDEFCVLEPIGQRTAEQVITAAKRALREHGQGFRIGASHGVVRLPSDARNASDALRAADERMYADKGRGARRPERQAQDVLVRVLREREPEVSHHVTRVAALAHSIAIEAGLDAEEIDVICRAAELHDIGKIAIPDAILAKPSPLDDDEWDLMRTHTLIGERILLAAPALGPVARLVRSSHERWDGRGYPDGLAGDEISLGSRMIFIGDAYEAMTSDRNHRSAMPPAEALAEIRARAGTQFDPQLVELFCRLIERGDEPAQRPQRAYGLNA